MKKGCRSSWRLWARLPYCVTKVGSILDLDLCISLRDPPVWKEEKGACSSECLRTFQLWGSVLGQVSEKWSLEQGSGHVNN